MHKNINNKINDGWYSVRDCYLSNDINKDTWESILKRVFYYDILLYKLKNCGYNPKHWDILRKRKAKVKKILEQTNPKLLKWEDISPHFRVKLINSSVKGLSFYTENEKMINLMETLVYGVNNNKSKNNN